MPLGKNGEPYEPMTAAQQQVARSRPFPPEFARNARELRAYQEAHAKDAAPVFRETEARSKPEAMGKAIKRNMTMKRKGVGR